MKISNVKGDTYVIDTGILDIPFYKINDEEIIMIDTGLREQREEIDTLLINNNLKVSGILCSHAHRDHVGNNKYLKNKYDSVIAMPAYEAFTCSSAVNIKVYYGTLSLSEVEKNFGHMVCETDIMISESQNEVEVCGIKFKIFHTPGHSPAHICIITPDDVAYVGDSLLSYADMDGSKLPYAFMLKEDLKSKEKLHSLRCSKYILAHKGTYDDITKLVTDNINFYKDRAARLYEIIDDAMSFEDLMKSVISKLNIHVKTIERYALIERLLKCNVEYLCEIGMVDKVLKDGVIKYIKRK